MWFGTNILLIINPKFLEYFSKKYKVSLQIGHFFNNLVHYLPIPTSFIWANYLRKYEDLYVINSTRYNIRMHLSWSVPLLILVVYFYINFYNVYGYYIDPLVTYINPFTTKYGIIMFSGIILSYLFFILILLTLDDSRESRNCFK